VIDEGKNTALGSCAGVFGLQKRNANLVLPWIPNAIWEMSMQKLLQTYKSHISPEKTEDSMYLNSKFHKFHDEQIFRFLRPIFAHFAIASFVAVS
jgi:hypothetical protein